MNVMVREKAFYKSFFWLTLVIGLQNIISLGVNLSDNLMLGGYSETALSGVALANQIQFLLHMLVMGAAEGLVIMSSRFWGAKDIGSIKNREHRDANGNRASRDAVARCIPVPACHVIIIYQ